VTLIFTDAILIGAVVSAPFAVHGRNYVHHAMSVRPIQERRPLGGSTNHSVEPNEQERL